MSDYFDDLPDGLVVLPDVFLPAPWVFDVPFRKIASEKFKTRFIEGKPYGESIMKVLMDYSVKDLQAVEDARFLEMVKTLVDAPPAPGVDAVLGAYSILRT